MFTGIVQEVGEVRTVEHGSDGSRLRVSMPATAARVAVGDSVAIEGVCLTATAVNAETVAFDAMGETLARTTLGSLAAGSPVNVEPALRASDPLGGHVVQGHVDAVAEVVDVRPDGIAAVVRIRVPDGLQRYLVQKGSVAVAGVSLTVSAVDGDAFEVWLIPHTREVTTLGRLAPGTRLNVEVDQLAKYVERLLAHRA
jgi:riboflavin synthase